MSDKTKFSSKTEDLEGPPVNPAIFPCVMLGSAITLGGILFVSGAEEILAATCSSPTKSAALFTIGGAISVIAAHGHAMVYNGNARRAFSVPHPTESSEVPYLNAGRGYYNLVEHFPFFVFNYVLGRESTPCVAGFLAITFGIGRVMYTHGYAHEGPKGRIPGFMVATFSSMACLGLALLMHGQELLR